MISIVTPSEMRAIDEAASREFQIPSLTLMEHAGCSVVEAIERKLFSLHKRRVLIVCGKGNNGGDGLVAARYAHQEGAMVTVLLVEPAKMLSGDPLQNYQRLRESNFTGIEILHSFDPQQLSGGHFDVIVDAIFGTSFHGSVKRKYNSIIRWINSRTSSKIVAVDVPSGLDAETGTVGSVAVAAAFTVTMAAPKTGFFLQSARKYTGDVHIADIGIPRKAVERYAGKKFWITESDIRRNLPRRPFNAHKHSVGKIFVLAGSKGLTGAALLCSRSAMASGAGAVILGVPSKVFSAVARRTLEVMPFELPSTEDGSVSLSSFPEIRKKAAWADVMVVGPGLSQQPETQELIERVIKGIDVPMVIDADGLNALSNKRSLLSILKRTKCILTPHLGEFSRLLDVPSREIESDKIRYAREFAIKRKVVLVLKGAPTIVADPKGNLVFNSTGNPGMATAGAGDVLAGIIAALVGQGNSLAEAAVNGVYIHGKAGDRARDRKTEMGLLAGDILHSIPAALHSVLHRNAT